MKNIGADVLLTGTVMGLLPQKGVASNLERAAIGASFKMGNGKSDKRGLMGDPEFRPLSFQT